MTDNLKSKALEGLSWSFAGEIIRLVFRFVFTAILARLLTPADFGLAAMAGVFINFARIFADLGISRALIQKMQVTEDHWSSAFWLNVVIGLMVTLVLIVSSPGIAHFYNQPELGKIISVLSINFVLSSLTIVQQSILTRNMDFFSLMIRDIGATFAAGILSVGLALRGWGVWSLVVQLLTFTAVNNLFLWRSSRWRPRRVFSKTALKDFFSFSANLTGSQILNSFTRNLDQLLIGKFLGAEALGYYSLAYKLMMLPLQNISWVISKVFFPVLSKVHEDTNRLHRIYLKLLKSISLISFPLMALLFVLAPELIQVIYGPRWFVVGELVRVMCFCGMLQSVGTTVGLIYQSVGKTNIQLRMEALSSAFILAVILTVIPYGLYAVTVGYTVVSILWVHIAMSVVCRMIGLRFRTMYAALGKSYLITTVLLITALLVKSVIVASDEVKIISVGSGFLFIFVLLLFVKGELKVQDRRLKVSLLD